MKDFKKIMYITLSLMMLYLCACKKCEKCNDCPPVTTNCMDSCTNCVSGIYTAGDSIYSSGTHEIASADIRIDEMNVSQDMTSLNLTCSIKVVNSNDDDANNAMLLVTLPADADLVNVNIGDAALQYQQCGAVLKICLGNLCTKTDSVPCTRTVTVETSNVKLDGLYLNTETFGAFVYSTTPDPCPANNFRCWLNSASSCIIPSVMVTKK